MITRRRFLTSAALGAPLVLSGCFTPRALEPVSDDTKRDLAKLGLSVGARLFVRVFKQENVMEAWLENPRGTYTLFRTYPICKWSGKLGPKKREGDRQAPEGFYVVSARQMNPNSKYYLSFNLGYPNAYDKAHGHTGSFLMVHGGCRSAGCYAITDDAIKELFILGREAFRAGQKEFPVHAFPFRMTEANMAAHADDPNIEFWRNLKEGYDMFERTHVPPVAAVDATGRYIFFPSKEQIPQDLFMRILAREPGAPVFIEGLK